MLAVKPNRSKASCDTIQTFIKSIVTLSVFKLTCFFSSGCRGFSLKLIKGINKNLHRIQIIIISTHYLFSDWPKVTKSALGTSSSHRLHNNHVKDTHGHGWSCYVWPRCMISKGNHVKFAPFALLADWYFFYTFRNKWLVPLTVVTFFFSFNV